MNCFETYEYAPFWHTLFASSGSACARARRRSRSLVRASGARNRPRRRCVFPRKDSAYAAVRPDERRCGRSFHAPFNRIGRCTVSCEYVDRAARCACPRLTKGRCALATPPSSFKVASIAEDEDDLVDALPEVGSVLPCRRAAFPRRIRPRPRKGARVAKGILRCDRPGERERVIDWLAETPSGTLSWLPGGPTTPTLAL